MKLDRRHLLKGSLASLAALGLRPLATGLPLAALTGGLPRAARAQAEGRAPQILIYCTSQAGDPFSNNAPGCDVPGTSVSTDPRMRRVPVVLGEARSSAAAPWAELPAALRRRLAFLIHQTDTNAHPEHGRVMRLNGAAKGPDGNGEDMLLSSIAAQNAEALGTIQREPVNLARPTLTAQGRVLPRVQPTDLKDLFAAGEGALRDLALARDRALDALYADLKRDGTAAQRSFLDQYARSRDQARQLGESLGELLQGLPADPEAPNGPEDQVRAAAALASLNVAPVIALTLPFGGDNHNDPGLLREAEETVAGVAALRLLWTELGRLGLQDRVTVAHHNVFGRTCIAQDLRGRDHNSLAHTLMIMGPHVRPGVYGGLARAGRDFAALGIDPRTGAGVPRGGIAPEDTLTSAGKTLCAAVGLGAAAIDRTVIGGRIVTGALV